MNDADVFGRGVMASARRVVVKVGSSSLTSTAGGIDETRVNALVDTLAGARARKLEIVLVSSGAIAAGLAPLGLSARPRDLARQQAAASVGQGLLMHRYTDAFARHGLRVGQVLLTVDDVTRRGHYRNAYRTFAKLLELGVVPIVNENDTVATTEIRFGDNDRLAALVAHLVHADALALLSDVDGVYDRDPRRAGASRVAVVREDADLAGVRAGRGGVLGSGGMASKLDAARIATGAGIPAVVAHADQVAAVLEGADVGTWFAPTGRRRSTRQLWLAHATEPKGQLVLDDGAVRAVTMRGTSLLPAGVTGVSGSFEAGEPVDLVSEEGSVIARGLVNYDAAEIPALLGRSTRDIAAELGDGYERELVHRDDLVLVRSPSESSPSASSR
ncbi:MAG TPA: glutamate 5-kinase [Nocardioidaceae bacterium]|nr:glutamate 5-kinase [Nocardioidaceae bacterium]